MEFKAGDIIILSRPKRSWYGFALTAIKQFFTFFFFNKGLFEAIDRWYHIEMGVSENMVITQEPPKCHLMIAPNVPMRVYRAKNPPVDLPGKFHTYAIANFGKKYNWIKFWAMMVDRIFHTRWFTIHYTNPDKDVCGEFVSRFYQEIGYPCTTESPESAIPSDVNAYCRDNPDKFEKVYDQE